VLGAETNPASDKSTCLELPGQLPLAGAIESTPNSKIREAPSSAKIDVRSRLTMGGSSGC
jgi:hypothetical protein